MSKTFWTFSRNGIAGFGVATDIDHMAQIIGVSPADCDMRELPDGAAAEIVCDMREASGPSHVPLSKVEIGNVFGWD